VGYRPLAGGAQRLPRDSGAGIECGSLLAANEPESADIQERYRQSPGSGYGPGLAVVGVPSSGCLRHNRRFAAGILARRGWPCRVGLGYEGAARFSAVKGRGESGRWPLFATIGAIARPVEVVLGQSRSRSARHRPHSQ